MKDIPREDLLTRLKEKHVTILTGFEAVCVECGLLQVRDKEGKLSPVRADTIIIAAGAAPEDALLKPLREKIPEVYAVGEAVRVGNAGDALRSAARLALSL
jgi:pyruvate/2-oxoglutarate dehydrogenase complex dihydrolipoamide dehydrogenase (E3) component